MNRTTVLVLIAWLAGAGGSACARSYGIYHRVAPGETLYGIGKAYGVSPEELKIVNGLRDEHLRAGAELYIPGAYAPRAVSVSRTSEKPALAPASKGVIVATDATPNGTERARVQEARLHPEDIETGVVQRGTRFVWPVKGVVFSKFGRRNGHPHDGIDISAPEGTPIYAAADGRVIYSGDGVRGYGNLIIIKHEGFYATVYAHNSENLVEKGDFVEKGQMIGRVGQTGRASGPHLHFEVRYNSKPVDPVAHLD